MRRFTTPIKITVGVLLVVFVARTLLRNFEELRSYNFALSVPYLLAAFLAGIVIYLSYGCIWYVITVRLGVSIPFLKSLQVWMNSALGKYLPGKIWMFMGRVYFYQQHARPAARISLAILVEAASSLLASVIVFLLSLWFVDVDLPRWVLGASVALLAVSLVAFHPRVLERAINLVLLLGKREKVRIDLGFGDLLRILFISILSVAAAGVFLWLIINSITPLTFENVGYLAAAYSAAGFLGILAVFAPGGIGVQEAVIILILQSIMPVPVATVISILARVLTIVVELVLVAALNGGHLALARTRLEKP